MESAEKLLKKMKEQNVQPIPKWRFTFKKLSISLIFVLSVLLGALAFSIILFAIQQLDFDLITHMSHSWFEFMLGLLPFFWIILLIVFLVLSIVSIRNSSRGYKFTSFRLVAINVALSIVAGTLFFISGGAGKLENVFAVKIGFYESVQAKKMKMWTIPEEGYMSGTIETVNDSFITLKDFDGNNWTIDISEANIAAVVLLEEEEQIKIIGKLIKEYHFYAEKIMPWGGPGSKGNRGMKK